MRFIIKGGEKLKGDIAVNGAKNGAFPLMAATLLTGQSTTLHNIPDISDVKCMMELMQNLGAEISFNNNTIHVHARQLKSSELNSVTSKKLRASILLAAPVLGRTGKASFSHPGGDLIGQRPIDLFLSGFKKLGASVESKEDSYDVVSDVFSGGKIVFPVISTTATMSIMTLATIAKGKTELINAACEPEIVMLSEFLTECGAKITGAGTSHITIGGDTVYDDREVSFTNISDRIEAGSFILMAVATKSNIKVTNVEPSHHEALLEVLNRMGAKIVATEKAIEVLAGKDLSAVSVRTHEYPGFPTDLQSAMIIAMTQASGKSRLEETIFEGRMFWLEDLKHMGAQVMILDTRSASIEGPSKLVGREVRSPDIRAGMAYIIAGLIAEGTTIVNDIELIDRGYENIESRLKKLGADINRED